MDEPLVLGRYRVVRRLAQGGMGVVYLGRVEGAAGFAKAVIIKRILPDLDHEQDNTARFIREAQILSHLQHPCIVGVLDFGQEKNGYAMVLEYMHGYDLGRWLQYLQLTSTRMPWEAAVFILLRALDGLQYAHTFRRSDGTPGGVLHRDISPGNILLDLEGQVRLLDFGIARMLQGDVSQYKTQDDVLSGKLSYLAPELFSSAASSISSDIYACGIVLYLMLAGAHPFRAESESHTIWRILNEVPTPLSSVRRGLPAELEATVFRALAKQPQLRPASAEQFAQELRRLLLRNEADILRDLRQRLRGDFTGEMPALLGLEPLAERDHAWRTAQRLADANATPLRSSRCPPAPDTKPVTVVWQPPSTTVVKLIPAAGHNSPPAALGGTIAPRPTARAVWKPGLALGIGSIVCIGGTLFMQHAAPAPAPARLIVVGNREPSAGETPLATALAQTDTDPATTPATAMSAAAMSPPGAADESGAIARQLARRQGALQGCFQELSRDRSGQTRVTISFDVAASGNVTAATLEPASLEGTSVGQCLLQVARETRFGALSNALRFSVPLRVRGASK